VPKVTRKEEFKAYKHAKAILVAAQKGVLDKKYTWRDILMAKVLIVLFEECQDE